MSAHAADHPEPAESHAALEAWEEAEIADTLAAHDECAAAGCPGARPHEDVMAELVGSHQ